ncbi:MAG TPA: DUF1722 domain-containing protein [Mariprofundaceae bacterium]|nr:DUF1722 domain-containing protein [Mariprofundaceae bacterium]
MRIWDLHPGYLDRKRLLGEHRELHGLFNIVHLGRKGYARHPETLRWVGHLSALAHRHQQLVLEMRLRGYRHQSPLPEIKGGIEWPATFINTPAGQFSLLGEKQAAEDSARIPLPKSTQQLWSQYKYAVMAHDPALYREVGPEVAHGRFASDFEGLASLLVKCLRLPLLPGRVHNALAHMWGYLDHAGAIPEDRAAMLDALQRGAEEQGLTYLLHSTALAGFVQG